MTDVSEKTRVLSNIRIVLVRPKFASNIGAVCRAMANTGLSSLFLVAPRTDPFSKDARKPSARAQDILYSARQCNSLSEALEGVQFTVGTSCRGGLYRDQIEQLPDTMAAQAVAQASRGNVAILFGTEDNGLSNEELLRCDALVRIPSSEDYPSLNLAQAVMVLVYEIYRAATCPRGNEINQLVSSKSSRSSLKDEPADGALIDRLMQTLRTGLLKIGYLQEENPEHLLFVLRNVLARSNPTRKEIQIWIGLAQQINSFADHSKQKD